MKKRKILILISIFVVTVSLMVCLFLLKPKEKINVYLFWGDGCPHCERAKEFFNSMDEDYAKYYNLVEYEVWYNEENNELMKEVASFLGISVKGVPFIVIGDKYFSGYSSSRDEEIKDIIMSEYESKDYVDIIEKVE